VGEEDCLYLNVWAPQEASGPLPVMVWLHGGGNSLGGTDAYDASRLAGDEHVVVVSVAYRLGPMGWLRHPALSAGGTPEEVGGNFGLLDQIAALRWVHDNVAAFGGDPAAVTLFGESAGGQDTLALLLAPQARGLYARAIAQSPIIRPSTPTEAEAWADQGGAAHSSREMLAKFAVSTRAVDAAGARVWVDAHADLGAWARSVPAEVILDVWAQQRGNRTGMLDMPMIDRKSVV
jgi:para-nitrobenzyl esterase